MSLGVGLVSLGTATATAPAERWLLNAEWPRVPLIGYVWDDTALWADENYWKN